ncbi:hypothetical protein Pelo_17980 [Pelomyxa schiedti]|nr:hypothetical protein Pelo_17980 [Pelomyxa schiedti]
MILLTKAQIQLTCCYVRPLLVGSKLDSHLWPWQSARDTACRFVLSADLASFFTRVHIDFANPFWISQIRSRLCQSVPDFVLGVAADADNDILKKFSVILSSILGTALTSLQPLRRKMQNRHKIIKDTPDCPGLCDMWLPQHIHFLI